MNRRDVLRAVVASLVVPGIALIPEAAAVVVKTEKAYVRAGFEFDPSKNYGNAIHLREPLSEVAGLGNVIEMLTVNARHYLPAGTPFYVLDMEGDRWGEFEKELFGVAWFYSPKPLSEERARCVIARVIA